MKITAELERKSMNDLQNHMADMKKKFKRSMSEIVIDTAIALVGQAKKRTKVGKRKQRRIRRNMEKYQQKRTTSGKFAKGFRAVRGSKAPKWLIIRPLQNGKTDVIPTNKKSDPQRRIRTRGIGLNSWGYALARLGQAKGRMLNNAGGRKYIRVLKQLKGVNPYIKIENDLEYIEKINPQFKMNVIRAARKGLRGSMRRRLGNKK